MFQACIGKNPSPTSAKNKAKLEYISEGQPSPLKLAFEVELGLNSHSKKSKRSNSNAATGVILIKGGNKKWRGR